MDRPLFGVSGKSEKTGGFFKWTKDQGDTRAEEGSLSTTPVGEMCAWVCVCLGGGLTAASKGDKVGDAE